jgi:hypothetical protein
MPKLNKHIIDFCIEAYGVLKDDSGTRACYIKFRKNDEKYIDYIMQKECWYHGKWSVYEGAVYAFSIEESMLIEWYNQKTPVKTTSI